MGHRRASVSPLCRFAVGREMEDEEENLGLLVRL